MSAATELTALAQEFEGLADQYEAHRAESSYIAGAVATYRICAQAAKRRAATAALREDPR